MNVLPSTLLKRSTPQEKTSEPESTLGYMQLLRQNRNFRLLFFGRAISLMGDWFNTLAIFALLDKIHGNTAQSFGWVLILKLLPLLVMSPAAGVVADRMNRKWIMIWTDVARVPVVLGFLLLSHWPRLDLLIALTVLQTSLGAFFEPARTAAVSQICSKDELISANTLLAVSWSIMLTLGAMIGGVVSHLFGWQAAIALDSLTYLVSAALLLPVVINRPAPRRVIRSWRHALGTHDAIDGFKYMLRHPAVGTMLWAKGAWGVAGGLTLLLTLFGQQIYPVAESPILGMTVFYAARGLGTALGPILSRRLMGRTSHLMHLAIGVSFFAAAIFYFALSLVHSLILSLVLVALAHFGGATIWVFSTVLIQRYVPHNYQGRVFAAEMALFTLTFSISTYVYGYLLDNRGWELHGLMRILAISIVLPGVLWSIAARTWPLIGEAHEAPVPRREDDY